VKNNFENIFEKPLDKMLKLWYTYNSGSRGLNDWIGVGKNFSLLKC
jgi:hypothetical protein